MRKAKADTPLQKILTERGWTHQRLAQATGISRCFITQIVNGATPSLANAQKIAATLEIPLDVLFPPLNLAMNRTQSCSQST